MKIEEWALLVACLSLVGSGVAIWQTRRYQNRADLVLSWDRIGLAGGIEELVFGADRVPFMRVNVTNHGNGVARRIDLTTTSEQIGNTQETDDGVLPYQERVELAPGETWEVQVPLFLIRESFDHPVEILERKLMRPTVTVRWRKEFSRTRQVKRFPLDGDWLRNYQSILRENQDDID